MDQHAAQNASVFEGESKKLIRNEKDSNPDLYSNGKALH